MANFAVISWISIISFLRRGQSTAIIYCFSRLIPTKALCLADKNQQTRFRRSSVDLKRWAEFLKHWHCVAFILFKRILWNFWEKIGFTFRLNTTTVLVVRTAIKRGSFGRRRLSGFQNSLD